MSETNPIADTKDFNPYKWFRQQKFTKTLSEYAKMIRLTDISDGIIYQLVLFNQDKTPWLNSFIVFHGDAFEFLSQNTNNSFGMFKEECDNRDKDCLEKELNRMLTMGKNHYYNNK